MSAKKKRVDGTGGLQALRDAVSASISDVKAKLSDDNDAAQAIQRLNRLVEKVKRLARFKPLPHDVADELDSEGVELWNKSTLMRPNGASSTEAPLRARLRYAGLMLILSGMEPNPEPDTAIRLLQLSTRTAQTLLLCNELSDAETALTEAASMEDIANPTTPESPDSLTARASAIVSYWTSRAELSVKQNNEPAAFKFMLPKATDSNLLKALPDADVQALVAKVLDIGKGFVSSPSIRSDRNETEYSSCSVAVKWLQKAMELIERIHVKDSAGVTELEMGILKSLARAYYIGSKDDPASILPAEESIKRLMEVAEDSPHLTQDERQNLRWMQFAIVKQKAHSDEEIDEAFRAIVDDLRFEEVTVTDVLQELSLLSESPQLLASTTRIFLARALDSTNNFGHPFIERILVFFIFNCTNTIATNTTALNHLTRMLEDISDNQSYALSKVSTNACHSLLFQIGTRYFQAKQYRMAADWFLACTHPAFKAAIPQNVSKCVRKAALSYIEAEDYATAESVLRKCATGEASTSYVLLLCHLYQGMEREAIETVDRLVAAPDFDRRMLLLATKLAHDRKQKSLILVILKHLLHSLQSSQALESQVEAMTLIRCIIRILGELINQPLAPIDVLVPQLLAHYNNAVEMIGTAIEKKSSAVILKDISWLWKTAYNTAIQACATWNEFHTAALFTVSCRLMDLHERANVGEISSDILMPRILASFSSICCRVFSIRKDEGPASKHDARKSLLEDIKAFRTVIVTNVSLLRDSQEKTRLDKLFGLAFVLEAEQACRLRDWERLAQIVENAASEDSLGSDVYESIADILWLDAACPTATISSSLEAIFRSTLDKAQVDTDRFSHWVRTLCSTLMARGRLEDKQKAMDYVEHAIVVMQSSDYPHDEQQWLLVTSYNAGVDCLQLRILDEGKRWFELATRIARHVPGEADEARKVEEAYKELLSRYGNRVDDSVTRLLPRAD